MCASTESTDFRSSLASLGLDSYYEQLVAEAFDSWPVLSEITETDLDALKVRLGHRRILQRAILEYKQSTSAPTRVPEALAVTGGLGLSNEASLHNQPLGPSTAKTHKRKYVRHPKEDKNAPKLPPTGYVLFSNDVREALKDEHYDFPIIAKIVGRKWQGLNQTEKEGYLAKAREFKAQYNRELASYKLTKEYQQYQDYLSDFRAKNAAAVARKKRSRPGEDEDTDESGERHTRSISISDETDDASVCPTESSSTVLGRPHAERTLAPLEIANIIRSPATTLEPTLSPSAPASHFAGNRMMPVAYMPSPETDHFRHLPPGFATRQLPPIFPLSR